MAKTFYITTPIYYVNDVPHIGHAYTTIAADILARYKRLTGHDVFFLTGTDEHGRKVEKSAEDGGEKPIELANRVVKRFQDLWTILNISNDGFIRTTEDRHKEAVQTLFPRVESLCDVYIPRDRMTRVRPHPDHLSLVLKRLEVSHASRCYMVGDHVSDIEAGKRVNMKTAGVLTGNATRENFTRAGSDLVLDDATGIMDYLP